MIYLLDTDTTIYWMKGDPNIEAKVLQVSLENVGITVLTCCELYYGAYKSKKVDHNLQAVKKLKEKVKVIHTSGEVDRHFGRTKAILEKGGMRLDDSDILIASIALSEGAVIVTNNVDHFRRIDGLRVDSWSRPR